MRNHTIAIVWFLAMTANLALGGEVEMKRLEKEAPAAFQRLIQGYSRLKAEGQWTSIKKGTRSAPDKVLLSDVPIAVVDDRAKVVMKFFSLDPTGTKRFDREKILCRGLLADFSLDRGPKTQERYVLSNMQARSEENERPTTVKLLIDNQAMRFVRSPFEFHGSVQDLIVQRKIKITSSESLKVDGQNVLRYKTTSDPFGDNSTTMTFELLPDHGWALHHAELEGNASAGSGRTQREFSFRDAMTVEYGDDQQGLPIPRRVRSESNLGDYLFEFRELTLGATIPDREFSMSYYGLPDASLPITVVNRPNYFLYGAFGLGVVTLAGSIWLWRRRKPRNGVEP